MSLLIRLLRRLEPREGWLPFLLTLVAALCLPAALLESPSGAADLRLLGISALAVVAGLWLARTRLSTGAVAIVAALLGSAVALVSAARVVPPLGVIWQGPQIAAAYTWQQIELFGIRLWSWAHQATAGTDAAHDTIALELGLSLLVWAVGLVTAWQVYRRSSGWRAVAAGGIAVSLTAFFLGGLTLFYFYVYLVVAFSLVAICRLWRQRARWERSGTDYPGSLGADVATALAPWLLVVLALAAVWPTLRVQSIQAAFWRQMEGPWARIESAAERFVGPIESDYRVPGAAGRGRDGTGGELPQVHLLGGGPDLDETLIFTVSTNDLPPAVTEEESTPSHPRRYWRRATYDVYTGLGWANSEVQVETVRAGQALARSLPPGANLVQQFELQSRDGRLYAANTPAWLDVPLTARWRAPGDLIEMAGDAERYAVVSRVPEPTVDALRASAALTSTRPTPLAGRYLTLPESLPPRVVALAREVVGDAPTRYDAAYRLERYLRTYPYELDLPEPPDDRDLVDYFLFDRQEGYCDYTASALVVMARAVGVPARLATGYAQGTYEPEAHRWVVTAENGHSWPEIYFDGIGWVEFEPTAGQVALVRPGSAAEAETLPPPLPPHPPRWWQRVPWGLVALVGSVVGLVVLLTWLWRPPRPAASGTLVQDRYARLLRWGARLRHPLRDGQTPHEYGQSLGTSLRARGSRARWARARRAAKEAPADVDDLVAAFVESRYSPHPTPERTTWRIHALWVRLRRHLLSLWLR
ncbi:MAG: DUF4129 domain-containing protein [Anaerolineae bacterium]|nr:DUF4129 domain-containing protein [Anaerolineae bacterium]